MNEVMCYIIDDEMSPASAIEKILKYMDHHKCMSEMDLMRLIWPNRQICANPDVGWRSPLDLGIHRFFDGRWAIKLTEPKDLVPLDVGESQLHDPIHHPSHYTEGRKYEPRKVIADWGLNFNLGNAVKYIARAGRKGSKIEDLKKAVQYLEFEIEDLENKEDQNG